LGLIPATCSVTRHPLAVLVKGLAAELEQAPKLHAQWWVLSLLTTCLV